MLLCRLKPFFNITISKVEIIPCQEGKDDYSLYCLGFLHSLLLNEDPGCVNYDQSSFRVRGKISHLCFHNRIFSDKRKKN